MGVRLGAYNEATGSFERMLLPGARRLQELRVVPETKALPEVESLDAALRPAPDQPTGKQA